MIQSMSASERLIFNSSCILIAPAEQAGNMSLRANVQRFGDPSQGHRHFTP